MHSLCFKNGWHAENQSDRKLKCLRADNGEEYVSADFQHFCESRGIKREMITPRTPTQNGVAERMNRTIQERMQCMLSHDAGLSGGFWTEALMTAIHVINRSPNANLDSDVAEEAWSGQEALLQSLAHFRV